MHIRTRYLVSLLLVCVITAQLYPQNGTYILNQQVYKVPLTSINISPDGSILLAGFEDGSFSLLDPETFGVELHVEDAHYKAVNAMDMPPRMDFILTAGGNTIKLWDRSGNFLLDWRGHATTVWNAEISNDGKWAVSSAINKTFLLWNVHDGAVEEYMRGHDDVTMAVAISPDNRLIASGSNDLTIKIWDLESRKLISTLHGPTEVIYDVDFSPDSHMLVAASRDRSARLYDLKEEKLVHILKGHRDMVLEAEFSPGGHYLVTGSADRSLILWDVRKGEKICQFTECEGAVMDLVFHPDGHSFYSITYEGELTRWELNPEIFVLRYFEKEYTEELAANPLFDPRRDGESKKDYLARMGEAARIKAEILDRYYSMYLSERDL